MLENLSIYRLGLVILSAFLAFDGAFAEQKGAEATLQISKFRFQRHAKQSFERLVLEFSKKERSKPSVKVSVDEKSHEATITLTGAQLVGAIPEASINDAYGSKSQYLGHLSVNTDNPSALTFKTALKDGDAKLDALWLENPARLVLDAFPKGSPRAAGPQVLDGRAVASKGASPKGHGGFVCFPANAQLNGIMDSESESDHMSIRIDSAVIPSSQEKMNGITCYPRNAQMKAQVVYAPAKAESTEKKEVASEKKSEAKAPVAKAAPKAAKVAVTAKAPTPTKLHPKPLLGNTEVKAKEMKKETASAEAKAHESEAAKKAAQAAAEAEKAAERMVKKSEKPSAKKTAGSLIPPMKAETKTAEKKIDVEEDGAESDVSTNVATKETARVPAAKAETKPAAKSGAGSLLPPLK